MGKRRHVIQRCRNLWEKRWPKMRLDIETADIETWEGRKSRCRFLMDTSKRQRL